MTIEDGSLSNLDRWAPRGSLIRFSMAGAFNSSIFFFLWAASMRVFSEEDLRWLWGVCWGFTGIMSHFVHRAYTFDDRKAVKWTLSTSLPVYVFTLVGSSLSIGWLSEMSPSNVEWLGVVNMLVWGVIIWLMMRLLVFQFKPITLHESQEHPVE